jgi:hypothetical protein
VSTEGLVVAGERLFGGKMPVRDWGLVEATLARPRATAFGQDAYPDVHSKAGALVHSVATSRPLTVRAGTASVRIHCSRGGRTHRAMGRNRGWSHDTCAPPRTAETWSDTL